MDLSRAEIAKKHGLPSQDSGWVYTEPVRAAMREYANQEARAYADWLGNQVIAGRTAHKLWLDYEAEILTGNEDRY